MTRPERRWDLNSPRTGRYTPAHCSSAMELKQEAIAAAPWASSPPAGLKRKYGTASAPSSLAAKKKRLPSAAAPPFMPTSAAAKRLEVREEKNTAPAPAVEKCCIHCTVGNEKSCLPCLRTACTCAETAAGISGQKKPEVDRMFLGVAIDGSNQEDEDGDHLTPLSIESNRRSSARSIGSSPKEKSKSPEEVTSVMDKNLSELLENMQNKWDTRQKALQDEHKELETEIAQVQQMARECGANENSSDWLALLEIIHSKRATKFFMGSDPVGRMAIIKYYARVRECRLLECQDLGRSQPRDIQIKSHLKRDAEPAEDPKKEWEEEFFNIAGLLDLSKKFQDSRVVGLLGLMEAKLAEDSEDELEEDFSTSS